MHGHLDLEPLEVRYVSHEHEHEGVLRLTPDELAEVTALDIPFETTAEWIGC